MPALSPSRAAPPYGRPGTAASARPAGPGHRLRLAAGLAALALLTRLPSFARPLWNPDEGYLAVQARMLAAGGELYATVVDRKPPLLPWLYHGAFTLFGDDSLWPLRVLAVLAHLLTALVLADIARRRWGERAGFTAGVLYLPASIGLNPEDAQAAVFEVFMLPATAAALWCADRRRWAAAGAMVAAAALTKQTGGAVLLPVLWLLWRHAGDGPARWRAAGALFGGLAAPVVAAALLTDPSRFLFWTLTGSGAYLSPAGSALHVAGRALANAALLAAACAGLLAPIAAAARRRARPRTADLWLWLAASAAGVALGFHFFGHYYLQLLPPLVLLGTAALRALPPSWLRLSMACSAVSCLAFLGWGAFAPRAELDHALRLATAVRQRTAPDQRVLFWGMHPEQYWLADRAPASRYLTAGLLTNYSGGRAGSRVGEAYAVAGAWGTFRRELAAAPPALIVDDSRGKPYGPRYVPTLGALLREHYRRTGTLDGAVFYTRREAGERPPPAEPPTGP
ncbi:ArnT family glycosyltransferase [Streptomyces sp. URMC 123]|uniref:ArnT family glycosyltransferase n=1 Tax=Streptomyces sp. URMC 123 TaxID=3423403 RepID=UPI003F1C5383